MGLFPATECACSGHAGSVRRSECMAMLLKLKLTVQKAKREHKEMKARRKSKARLHKMSADELAALNQAAADEVRSTALRPSERSCERRMENSA